MRKEIFLVFINKEAEFLLNNLNLLKRLNGFTEDNIKGNYRMENNFIILIPEVV